MPRRNAALLVIAVVIVAWQGIAGAQRPNRATNRSDKVAICHKPGTPAQKTLTLPEQAARQHIRRHGDAPGACPGAVTTTTGGVTTTTGGVTTTTGGVTTTTEAPTTTTVASTTTTVAPSTTVGN